MLFIFVSASTAARVPTTAQASTPSRDDAAVSHIVTPTSSAKKNDGRLAMGQELPLEDAKGAEIGDGGRSDSFA